MRKNHRPCPKCGKPMHRQSKQCRQCYEKEKAKPQNYVIRWCPVCGNIFSVHKCQVERGQGKYCSRSCAGSGSPSKKRDRMIVCCAYCGKDFEKFPSSIQRTKGDKDFCSLDCWYAYNQMENHYLWKGGQHDRVNPSYLKWRKAVLERDKYFCRICHRRYDDLEAHHIYPFTTYPLFRWVVDNGITLCKSCHRMYYGCEEDYIDIFSAMAKIPVEVWEIEITEEGYTFTLA